jgi:uncharacterized protein DUF2846
MAAWQDCSRATSLSGRSVRLTLFIAIGLWLACLVAPAAAQATKPTARIKPTPQPPSQATIYFVRRQGIVLGSPDILIDGHKVGELATGTYFVLSRPPGQHVVEVLGGFFSVGWQTELDFTAGQTYFLGIGAMETGAAIGTVGLQRLFAGTMGRELPGHGYGSLRFFAIDAEAGRAALANLKDVTH